MTDYTNTAESQAQAQYESLVAMLAAVNCDYDRLDELTDELQEVCNEQSENNVFDDWVKDQSENAEAVFYDSAVEYIALKDKADKCESRDDAIERIQEDPLSVEVRSDWVTPGEEMTAGEFQILLCTGGPAVRIMGELSDHGEPDRAWLEYQDWGTQWTRYYGADSATLCEYAANFLGY